MSGKIHTLLVVESPAKAKTIERYLGPGYSVVASMGHLIDLPKSRIAIDVEDGFEPEYITVRGKAKILKELLSQAKKAGHVLLASDNDREGEAISYHLKRAMLKKDPNLKIERIVFNEITPTAIKESLKSPGDVEIPKVDAQKARRVLDRLVGYNLSPLLWKKVKNGLSAGRVQSVALRLICDREKEVESFIPEEYWTLDAALKKGKTAFKAQLYLYKGEKPVLNHEDAVTIVTDAVTGAEFVVKDKREMEKQLRPKAPYTTSKLQQDAANRLGFTSRKTMQIAQQLYEGINLKSSRVGLITYMRTDSVRISDLAMGELRAFIGERYPEELPDAVQNYSMGKRSQDAHEAIRPTYVTYTPEDVKEHLTKDQLKLYSIIWERYVSSQMSPAIAKSVAIDIEAGEAGFKATATKIVKKGFHRALKLLATKSTAQSLPDIKPGDALSFVEFLKEQHFTSGPSRYTDASIVKALEEKGIGRPSTYAPIISVLLDRYYVVRKNRQLIPTILGRTISELLLNAFPDILDVNFTAEMENRLDNVEDQKEEWALMLKEFYGPFKDKVNHVMETLEKITVKELEDETDYVCEKCGKPMVKKLGRFGFFLACSGFPQCLNTKSLPLADCPKPGCGGKIVARKKQGGRGKEFYGCTNYPNCDFITHHKPSALSCPKCGWFLVEKEDKKKGNHKECINPACDFLHFEGEEEAPGDD